MVRNFVLNLVTDRKYVTIDGVECALFFFFPLKSIFQKGCHALSAGWTTPLLRSGILAYSYACFYVRTSTSPGLLPWLGQAREPILALFPILHKSRRLSQISMLNLTA